MEGEVKDLRTLQATVLRVRGDHYPELPESVVLDVLLAEATHLEDRTRAQDQVGKVIATHVAETGSA